jgi:hypothetical protein
MERTEAIRAVVLRFSGYRGAGLPERPVNTTDPGAGAAPG